MGFLRKKYEFWGHPVREEMKNTLRRFGGDFCGDFGVKM